MTYQNLSRYSRYDITIQVTSETQSSWKYSRALRKKTLGMKLHCSTTEKANGYSHLIRCYITQQGKDVVDLDLFNFP